MIQSPLFAAWDATFRNYGDQTVTEPMVRPAPQSYREASFRKSQLVTFSGTRRSQACRPS
jgi:hypothetical protein